MCERKDEAPGKDCGEIAHERQQADGELFPSYMFFVIFWGKEIVKSLHLTVLHTVHLEQFMPKLESLLAYFCLPYDTGNLKTTADEMELFSMVYLSSKKGGEI